MLQKYYTGLIYISLLIQCNINIINYTIIIIKGSFCFIINFIPFIYKEIKDYYNEYYKEMYFTKYIIMKGEKCKKNSKEIFTYTLIKRIYESNFKNHRKVMYMK